MNDTAILQQTPKTTRVALVGLGATILAVILNLSWLWVCTNLLDLTFQIPQALGVTTLIPLTESRVALATAMAGLVGTIGTFFLSKVVNFARTWCVITGFGIGFASLYGALTLPNQKLGHNLALATMHAVATFVIVPSIALAMGKDSVPRN